MYYGLSVKENRAFQEGMHFFLKQKNTRFSSAHFKPYSMTWSDLQYYLFVFELSESGS